MKYTSYRYIYPPRPKNAIPSSDLYNYDNGTMLAQPKLDGSNCIVFTDGVTVRAMNRHGAVLTNFDIPKEEILRLYKGTGGWTVLNGEYMNKSKKDGFGKTFNHKFVIFDVLVVDGNYLVGKTFEQRVGMLDEAYGTSDSDHPYLHGISENIFRVRTYRQQFFERFDTLSRIDMVEGLVMKRRNARLEIGNTELNNTKSQIKCRKATKNYKY